MSIRAWRPFIALFVAAIALRPQLIGLGPLFPQMLPDLGATHAVAGLLGTIPLICMGLFAIAAPTVNTIVGPRVAIGLCLVILAVVGAVRAVAPSIELLILLTIPIGLVIGLAGAVLPVLVKDRFPLHGGIATGIYTTAIQVGSTASAAIAVPLAALLGGWRGALLAFAAVGAISLLLWWASSDVDEAASRPARPRLTAIAWRDRVAWLLAVIFWLEAVPFYGLTSWLAADYVEHGWSEISAGVLVSMVGLFGLPASLIVGWLSQRLPSRREPLIASCVVLIVALVGLIAGGPLAWVWSAVAGAMLGAQFTLSLLLPLDVSHDSRRVAAVTGVALGAGYLLTAVTPSGLGFVRDLTGSFDASLWVMVAGVALLLAVSFLATPARLSGGRAAAENEALRRQPTEVGAG